MRDLLAPIFFMSEKSQDAHAIWIFFFFLSFIQGGFHRGVGYVEFDKPEAAEKARAHMDEGQIDGNVVRIQFVVPPKVIRSSMLPFFCFFSSFLSFES